ncbi:MAG: signal peptidase II [Andreesenia angusta]|nr:signal peptidase II [Andreesenia angusta]
MNIIMIIILFLDQITKFLATKLLKGNESIHLIRKFLNFTYVENRGAAFGILEEKKIFFILTTIIIVFLLITALIYYRKTMTKKFEISLKLIMVGSIGNLIDRILNSYVIDFIDIKFGGLYDFPVFNIADISIVIGTILLMYLILTDKLEKEEDIFE